jgi:hypothetical protein
MDSKTKNSLVLLSALIIIAALGCIWTPWPLQQLVQIVVVLAIAGIGCAVFKVISKIILERKGMKRLSEITANGSQSAEIWSAKPIILFFVIFVVEFFWLFAMMRFKSFLMAELGYYIFLLGFGFALSRWANAKQYVAILAPVILIMLYATLDIVSFLTNSSNQFRFGPEIVLFAASEIIGKLAMIPLDAVVVWGVWSIAESIRKPSADAGYAAAASGADGRR